MATLTLKRKMNVNEPTTAPQSKVAKTVYPAYFIPELAHVVAMCDEKLPFIVLAQELNRRKLAHSGVQVEANSTSLVLKLLEMPMPENKTNSKTIPTIHKTIWTALTKRLLSVSLRTQSKNNFGFWTVELIFYETPLKSKHNREQGQRRPVYFQYDLGTSETVGKTVENLLDDWSRIVYLYCLVHDFSEQFKNGELDFCTQFLLVFFLTRQIFFATELNLQNHVVIKSYSYTNLLIGYGPNKEVTASVSWCTKSKEYKLIFNGGNSAINAHSMMQEQLQSHLNYHHNLSQVVHLLHETYQPLSSIAKLPIIPQLGIKVSLNNRKKKQFFDFEFSNFFYFCRNSCKNHKSRCCRSAYYHNRQRCCASRIKRCIAWKFACVAVVSFQFVTAHIRASFVAMSSKSSRQHKV